MSSSSAATARSSAHRPTTSARKTRSSYRLQNANEVEGAIDFERRQGRASPAQARAMTSWLHFNDTWLAAEWGHPSDNHGGILAVADWLSRNAVVAGRNPLTVRDVLTAMIKAHEIQGVIALENSFNRVGLDHVVLVKVASTAVAAQLLGLTKDEIIDALSLAWVDGASLRTYRHAPNTGSRKIGSAHQPCRPRSLHPVHGGRAADLRSADRLGLRGRSRCRSPYRCVARENRLRRGFRLLARLPRSGQALDR